MTSKTSTPTLADMCLTSTQRTRKTELALGVGTGTYGRASVTLQAEFSNGKAALWVRFAQESAESRTYMQGAGWRYVDTRGSWWAYVTPAHEAEASALTGVQVGARKAATPAKTATPARKSAPKAAPVEKPATPAPADTSTPKTKSSDWRELDTPALVARMRRHVALLDQMVAELESRKHA